ncbi:hypothetical protein ETB55_21685 [Salmonella enterica subsp. enterica serovar Omuna]|nr:hypothetical protein [Salmonella enterica subsp. enterica serovar Omuna]
MDFVKNYGDNEKLKADVDKLNDEIFDLYCRVNQMASDYSHQSGNLADRLAGMVLRTAGDDLASVSKKINELAFQFTK